jgi:hypothetical protein
MELIKFLERCCAVVNNFLYLNLFLLCAPIFWQFKNAVNNVHVQLAINYAVL